jgi:hypothetical protein
VVGAIGLMPVTSQALTFTVTNTLDSGDSSLRDAIEKANTTAAPDTIAFNIPGAGLQTINVTGSLPAIVAPLTIDGYTQSDATPNTLAVGDDAVLRVRLNGDGAQKLVALTTTGLTINSSDCLIKGLVINNFDTGLRIEGDSATGNKVRGCFIGINAAGNTAVPNREGIVVQAPDNTIGGTIPAARNIVSGNARDGIVITGSESISGNVVLGNYVGTNRNGTLAVGNTRGLVTIDAVQGNIIGGAADGSGNVISGNGYVGVALFAGHDNIVQGNRIGTTAAGNAALPNVADGVGISGDAHDNLIGGTTVGAGNLISGNGRDGIRIDGETVIKNKVLGNRIGTNKGGAAAVPNAGQGVHIWNGSDSNTIGGPTKSARNMISGNSANGIFLDGTDKDGANIATNFNVVHGNYIGTAANGTDDVGIALSGIAVKGQSQFNYIGGLGDGEGNRIAFNKAEGILLTASASAESIRANSIFSNGRLGINLSVAGDPANGVTPNDNDDTDSGPNGLLNYPVLTSATYSSNTNLTLIKGKLDMRPSKSFSVDFYSSPAADPSGFGEGKTYLGSASYTTNADGVVNFEKSFALNLSNQVITATTTAIGLGAATTSEFSKSVPVQQALSSQLASLLQNSTVE